MQIGYYGLGKMGYNMVLRMQGKGHDVIAANRSSEPRQRIAAQGIKTAATLAELVGALATPRTVWVMVSHEAVDAVFAELVPLLQEGDTVIDGGNSFYKDSVRHAQELAAKKINFLDVGTSGGPAGAQSGACIMVGGTPEVYRRYEALFADLSAPGAYGHMGKAGAGHFVKMVHNGIEYGMMQAIGEGFEILKKSEFSVNLAEAARVYNSQSVITSRLTEWLVRAYKQEGADLAAISGEVGASGEGQWTVETAREMGILIPVIEAAMEFRTQSKGNPSYTGQVVSALRGQFGGHAVKKGD